MKRDEIVAKVDEVLIDEFELDAGDLRPEAHLFDDLGLDSLDAVDLIVALEHTFGGRVPEEEAKKVRIVADIYGLIERTVAAT